MSSPPSGPGKTAPKLLQDFLIFDPSHGKPNVLADHSPPVGEGAQLAPSRNSCKHEYATKFEQSVPPPLDLRPNGTTQHKIAAVCKKCRIHADVSIDYHRSMDPCPDSENPVHHFQRLEEHDLSSTQQIRFAWACSAQPCQALLQITYRPPRLTSTDRNVLTDTELLKQRFQVVVQQNPERDGIRQATPMDALSRLRKYVRDALNPQHEKRTFPAHNKRFMEAFGLFGEDCQDLLERLGFKYADLTWSLPNPPEIEDRLQADGSSDREMLEDVEFELLAWMYKIASETGAVNTAASEGWPSANRDTERTLAAQGYRRHISIRRSTSTNEDLPYFSSLGALDDFADSLIEFAFDRQSNCDPERQAYYFECLQVITDSRKTEALQMKVVTLQSQDVVSRRDLAAAYRFLNIQGSARDVSDERIIHLFQAWQPDVGAAAAEEGRQALYRIGVSRQSQLLINASRQAVDTYEDALNWLGNGASKDSPDESLLAILAVKTAENAANDETGRKAISTIAKARHSDLLNNWILTGRTDGYTMSVKEALTHFNIEQDLKDVSPEIWPVVFANAKAERPGEQTDKAIKVLQGALAAQTDTAMHSPDTWPVGLTSHGNTCYLNSLLQYYFSIKRLRDIILDYDRYKMDTSADDAMKRERVGQRPISMVEIKGGQRFAQDLKDLFERMIKDPGSAVKPEQDLVCRAFLPPKDYALLASSVREEVPITLNGAADAVTEVAETPEPTGLESAAIENTADATPRSDASSVTLQASVNGKDGDASMSDTEVNSEPTHAPPLPPRRFSTTKEQALALAQEKARQQQDVTEVHDSVMWRLRAGMKPEGEDDAGEQWDSLRALFSIGMTETTITNGVAGKPNPTFDSSIQLNVPEEATDINAALDDVFDLQEYEGKSGMQTYKSIRKLPPLLQISIPRIGFDKQTGQAFKSDKMIKLEDELQLDRFLGDPHVLGRRKTCWGWRKQLRDLRKEQKALEQSSAGEGIDSPAAVAETSKYLETVRDANEELRAMELEGIDVDDALVTALSEASRQQAARLAAISAEIAELQPKLDRLFVDLENTRKFRLAAVFFHRGAAGHGHYWIYIKDFAEGIWRSYNDERVEEFKKMEDIFEASAWQQGTPTYAVYVQDDLKNEIQPVCRQPEEIIAPQLETQDVRMEDVAPAELVAGDTVDPKMVSLGGQDSWNTERRVNADAEW